MGRGIGGQPFRKAPRQRKAVDVRIAVQVRVVEQPFAVARSPNPFDYLAAGRECHSGGCGDRRTTRDRYGGDIRLRRVRGISQAPSIGGEGYRLGVEPDGQAHRVAVRASGPRDPAHEHIAGALPI